MPICLTLTQRHSLSYIKSTGWDFRNQCNQDKRRHDMNTIKEVSRITGVSPRTLHYYDSIGLLKPARVTESGYRLYDEASLERLQHILLFKELRFPLKKIKQILDSPDFDRNLALEQQLNLLLLQKEHLENLIDLTRGIRMTGVKNLDFLHLMQKKIDEYAAQAKTAWGKSAAYREYEEKMKNRSRRRLYVHKPIFHGIIQ